MNADMKERTAKRDGVAYPSPLLLTHLPASHLVLQSSCFTVSTRRCVTICTGQWRETRWEHQGQLNHQAAWLCPGRNYKAPRRVRAYCFLLIHYQIRFVHKSLFPLPPQLPAGSCSCAGVNESNIWPAKKLLWTQFYLDFQILKSICKAGN